MAGMAGMAAPSHHSHPGLRRGVPVYGRPDETLISLEKVALLACRIPPEVHEMARPPDRRVGSEVDSHLVTCRR